MKTINILQESMAKTIIKFAIITVAICACHYHSCAQERDSTIVYQVETSDGNAYIGRIIYEDNDRLLLKTDKLGELALRKMDIRKINQVSIDKIKKGIYWFENPQSTRYFWTPNGYGLKKGEGYYQNIWVLFNQFSIGITDNFSVGGGLIPLFLFRAGSTPVWITPKVSIPIRKDKLNIGVGGLFAEVLGESETGFGIVYGLTTFGSRDQNITLGLGYGYAAGAWAKTPTITLSSMIRTGQRGYFLTENYYISTGDSHLALLSIGGRRIINKAGLDFGVFIPVNNNIDKLVAIPWLGITVPFGRSRIK